MLEPVERGVRYVLVELQPSLAELAENAICLQVSDTGIAEQILSSLFHVSFPVTRGLNLCDICLDILLCNLNNIINLRGSGSSASRSRGDRLIHDLVAFYTALSDRRALR